MAAGGLALPQLLNLEAQANTGSSHKAIINIYLPGGPSHLDMFDLKPDAPAEIRGKEIGKLTTFWFLGQFLSPIIIFPLLKASSIITTFTVAAFFLFILAMGWFFGHFSSKNKVAAL